MSHLTIEKLHDLLDKEREILKAGAFDELEYLLNSKEALLKDLAQNPQLAKSDLGSIRSKVSDNKSLLEASLKGLKRAQNTISEFRQIRTCLSLYGKNGDKINIQTQAGGQLYKTS